MGSLDPAVFFLLSPRCLEKHKDFDIWAARRRENKTSAHSERFSSDTGQERTTE